MVHIAPVDLPVRPVLADGVELAAPVAPVAPVDLADLVELVVPPVRPDLPDVPDVPDLPDLPDWQGLPAKFARGHWLGYFVQTD